MLLKPLSKVLDAVGMISFFLRAPYFPIPIESDDRVFSAFEAEELSKLANEAAFLSKTNYDAVDGNTESWSYVPKVNALSPLTINKRWSKKK